MPPPHRDFLFVHPRISGQLEPVRGVGLGILQGLYCLATILGCQRVWGEATRDSAPFYERQLGRSVADSFLRTRQSPASKQFNASDFLNYWCGPLFLAPSGRDRSAGR